jgi:hypothetical protein
MNVSFTPETLAGIIGVVFTLLFAYFPKLRTWYAGLTSEVKSGIMLGLLAISALVIFLLANAGVITTNEPVTWELFVKVLFLAIMTNQPTYQLLPQAADVKFAKQLRDGLAS